MPRNNEHEFLSEVLLGCEPAIAFCQTLAQISQVLDDLVDKDKPVPDIDIVNSYWKALIEIPANPFYRQHEPYLRPLMASSILDWSDSVALEREGSSHALRLSFVLRDQLGSIVSHCAYLIGGVGHMNNVSLKVREHVHEDSFDEYESNLREAQS